MRQCTVILAGIPDLFECVRQRDHGRNLSGSITQIHVVQGLVVDELINCRRVEQILVDLLAPVRPVVALKDHIGLVAELLICLDDVFCPVVRIPDLRTAESIQVVQRTGAVFCHPEGAVLRKISVHLCGRFCTRCELKFDL